MNHNSGFTIKIANVFFAKILIEHTPKTCPPTKNNALVVLCNDYRSTSKDQVKRKKYEHLWENWNLQFCS